MQKSDLTKHLILKNSPNLYIIEYSGRRTYRSRFLRTFPITNSAFNICALFLTYITASRGYNEQNRTLKAVRSKRRALQLVII